MKMNKKSKFFLLSLLSFFFTTIISCHKERIDSKTLPLESVAQKMINSGNDKNLIIEWLEQYGLNVKSKEKDNFNEITQNLNYGALTIEKRKNGEQLIIVPMTNLVRKQLLVNKNFLKFDEKTIFNLIIVQNGSGKLRWATVIAYLPAVGVQKNKLSNKTVQNIFNGSQVSDNGIYKFIDLKGKLQYQIEYKNDKLYSFGKPAQKNLSKKTSGEMTISSIKCTDWYLVTTYYYDDGSTFQTEEFLFTTCDDTEEVPGGGGGGGGTPDEPNDHEITVSGSLDVYETDYDSEDYRTQRQQEGLDDDGNILEPVQNVVPYKFNYTWNYTYNAVGPLIIKGVIMNNATVHPANVSYTTSLGQVTRDLTLINHSNYATNNGSTATLNWNFLVFRRITNTTTNSTKVDMLPKSHTKTVPF